MQKNVVLSKWKIYWKNSWTKNTTIYFFVSLFFMILIILLTGFFKKQLSYKMAWSNAITVGCVIILVLSIIVVLIRKGLGKGLFRSFVGYYHNVKISSRAKKKYSSYMTQYEKDKILINERQKYNNEQNKKNLKKKLEEATNLTSYLLMSISIFTLTIGLLVIHYS